MASRKSPPAPAPGPPTLTRTAAIPKLLALLTEGNGLADKEGITADERLAWITKAQMMVDAALGPNTDHAKQFASAGSRYFGLLNASEHDIARARGDEIRSKVTKLRAFVDHFKSLEDIPGAETDEDTKMPSSPPDKTKVFVIHGRNLEARKQTGIFLRALGLEPINFDDLRASLGGSPAVADIVTEGMDRAQGVVALFTPDEQAYLRPEYRSSGETGEPIERWQARPNVIFEAGMAFARDRTRIVFVALGRVQFFTDIGGIHVLRPTNDPKTHRNTLRNTLKGMGCEVKESADWMNDGDFESPVRGLSEVSPPDPFRT